MIKSKRKSIAPLLEERSTASSASTTTTTMKPKQNPYLSRTIVTKSLPKGMGVKKRQNPSTAIANSSAAPIAASITPAPAFPSSSLSSSTMQATTTTAVTAATIRMTDDDVPNEPPIEQSTECVANPPPIRIIAEEEESFYVEAEASGNHFRTVPAAEEDDDANHGGENASADADFDQQQKESLHQSPQVQDDQDLLLLEVLEENEKITQDKTLTDNTDKTISTNTNGTKKPVSIIEKLKAMKKIQIDDDYLNEETQKDNEIQEKIGPISPVADPTASGTNQLSVAASVLQVPLNEVPAPVAPTSTTTTTDKQTDSNLNGYRRLTDKQARQIKYYKKKSEQSQREMLGTTLDGLKLSHLTSHFTQHQINYFSEFIRLSLADLKALGIDNEAEQEILYEVIQLYGKGQPAAGEISQAEMIQILRNTSTHVLRLAGRLHPDNGHGRVQRADKHGNQYMYGIRQLCKKLETAAADAEADADECFNVGTVSVSSVIEQDKMIVDKCQDLQKKLFEFKSWLEKLVMAGTETGGGAGGASTCGGCEIAETGHGDEGYLEVPEVKCGAGSRLSKITATTTIIISAGVGGLICTIGGLGLGYYFYKR